MKIHPPITPGQIFGKLTALREESKGRYPSKAKWRCKCACGNEHVVQIDNLRDGVTTMCLPCARKKQGETNSANTAKYHEEMRIKRLMSLKRRMCC